MNKYGMRKRNIIKKEKNANKAVIITYRMPRTNCEH
jgi:hypothetical protein